MTTATIAAAGEPVHTSAARLTIVRTSGRDPGVAAPETTRVVIADGRALARAGLRALLEGSGRIRVVAEAATGEEAVATAASSQADVVLIDAGLPGLDCLEATKLMSGESGPAVMLLTSSPSEERMVAALRAGASGVLLKDADPAELVRGVGVLARGEPVLPAVLTRRLIAELAYRPQPQCPDLALLDELTVREREVVALVGLGLSNDQIAERLVISPATAKTHVSRAMLKINARDRAVLVVFAYEVGLVPRAFTRP